MVQTSAGARKAVAVILEKYGKDFYSKIGKMGGGYSCQKGFASDKVGADGLTGRQRARIAGVKGGSKSKRTRAKNNEGEVVGYALKDTRTGKVVESAGDISAILEGKNETTK